MNATLILSAPLLPLNENCWKIFGSDIAQRTALFTEWKTLSASSNKMADLKQMCDSVERVMRQLNLLGEDLYESHIIADQFRDKMSLYILLQQRSRPPERLDYDRDATSSGQVLASGKTLSP